VIERRAEAMQEGDRAEPRASSCGGVGVTHHAYGSAEEPLEDELVQVHSRPRRDSAVARRTAGDRYPIAVRATINLPATRRPPGRVQKRSAPSERSRSLRGGFGTHFAFTKQPAVPSTTQGHALSNAREP